VPQQHAPSRFLKVAERAPLHHAYPAFSRFMAALPRVSRFLADHPKTSRFVFRLAHSVLDLHPSRCTSARLTILTQAEFAALHHRPQ